MLEGKFGNVAKEDKEIGLIAAVKCGKKECLQLLIDSGSDINCTDGNENTLLLLAVINEHVDVVEYLVSKIKDIDKKNNDGNSALHFAARQGNTHVVKMLLEWGANKSVVDNRQNTALMLAAETGQIETVKFLIIAGFDVTAENCHKETALHKAVFADNIEVNHILVEAGASLNATTIWGHTPLHSAVLFDKHQPLKDLLKLGANISKKDEVEWTVLHIACRNCCIRCCEILLSNCSMADINESDPLGLTPLSVAVHYKFVDGVKLLIKAGALIKGFHGECLLKISTCILDEKYEMARILVMSGQVTNVELWEQKELIKKDKLDERGKAFVQELLATPSSLQHLCRIFIRKELTNRSAGERHGTDVYKSLKKDDVYSLQLPLTVKDYLMFSDL